MQFPLLLKFSAAIFLKFSSFPIKTICDTLEKLPNHFSGLFGVCNYGVDINGYVMDKEKGLCLWLQRRSPTKQTWPGKWDNMVCKIFLILEMVILLELFAVIKCKHSLCSSVVYIFFIFPLSCSSECLTVSRVEKSKSKEGFGN